MSSFDSESTPRERAKNSPQRAARDAFERRGGSGTIGLGIESDASDAAPSQVASLAPNEAVEVKAPMTETESTILEKWDDVARAHRRESTRADILAAAKMHDDLLDVHERRVSRLDKDLDENERAHRREEDAHRKRLQSMLARYGSEAKETDERSIDELRALFERLNDEEAAAHSRWATDMAKLEEAEARVAREHGDTLRQLRGDFEDLREELRNQHGEDVSTMKMMYEAKIKELDDQMAQDAAATWRKKDLVDCGVSPRRRRSQTLDDQTMYNLVREQNDADQRWMYALRKKYLRYRDGIRYYRSKRAANAARQSIAEADYNAVLHAMVGDYSDAQRSAGEESRDRYHSMRNLCVASEFAIKELTLCLDRAKRSMRTGRDFARGAQRTDVGPHRAPSGKLASLSNDIIDARVSAFTPDELDRADALADATLKKYYDSVRTRN